jgi:hypothetical protein
MVTGFLFRNRNKVASKQKSYQSPRSECRMTNEKTNEKMETQDPVIETMEALWLELDEQT